MMFSIVAPAIAAADPATASTAVPTAAEPAQYAADNSAGDAGQSAAFSDIQSHWAYKEIMELAATNIVAGFEDGTFQPSGKVTREQFLKMLVELRKLNHASADEPFKDVDPQRWSAPYVAAGLTSGILLQTDYPDGNFKPSQPITRAEMAVWIVRALQLPPAQDENLLGKLKDQASLKQNRGLIEAALETGIIQGYPDGNFKGGNNSTRAEAAVMLVRALHYTPGQTPATTPTTPATPSQDTGADRKIVEYRPDVKISKSTNYAMRGDSNTWVIKDPNLKLNVGDVFVMPPNDKYYGGIAKKVVSVSQENGALVVKTSVPRLKEVFSKLDIATTEPINPKLLKPIDSSVTIKTSEVAAQSTSLTLPCMNIAMNNAYVEGVKLNANMNFCNLGVRADIGLDIDWDWFDTSLDFYSELVLIGDVTTNVHVEGDTHNAKLNEPKFIPLTTPYYVPVFTGVFVKAQLFLRIDPDFKSTTVVVNFNDKFHLEEGFSLSSSHGLHGIDKTTNTATLDVTTKLDARLSAGPDAQLTLTLLDIAYAGFDLFPGIQVGYQSNYDQGRCDSLTVDAFLRLDVIAGYDVWVASDDFRYNVFDLNGRLFQYDLHCPPPRAPANLSYKLIGVRGGGGKYNELVINRTDVQLSWDAVTDAASYNVKRTEAASGAVKVMHTATPAYKDATAAIGKTYYYQVTASNENGEGNPSNTITVVVTAQPPPAPQNLTGARKGMDAVLNWQDVGGFVTYSVERAEGSGTAYTVIATNVSGTTYTDSTASPLRSFSYRIRAGDSSGTSDPSNVVLVPRSDFEIVGVVTNPAVNLDQYMIPPAPGSLTAAAGSGKVDLGWSAVSAATSYNVKRSIAAAGPYTTIGANVSGTTYTDNVILGGTKYYYKVTAVNSAGNESADSPIQSATPSTNTSIIVTPINPGLTNQPIFVRPAAPANFSASTDIGTGKVILTWSAVSSAAGYNVMRSDDPNGSFQTIGSKVGGTTFTDTTGAIGTKYYYKVTALSSNGTESNPTPVQSAIPSSGIR